MCTVVFGLRGLLSHANTTVMGRDQASIGFDKAHSFSYYGRAQSGIDLHTYAAATDWIACVLDKTSPIPLYYQLAESIKEQIRLGELKPGDQLPSERILSEQHAISRMTARQAIAYLTREEAWPADYPGGIAVFTGGPPRGTLLEALASNGLTEVSSL